jgi:hypothetical protein
MQTVALEHKGKLICSSTMRDVDELWMIARTGADDLSLIWKEKQKTGCEYADEIERMLRKDVLPKLYVGALVPIPKTTHP